MIDDEMGLSAAGKARRDQILRLAVGEAGARKRRRRVARAGMVLTIIGISVSAFFMFQRVEHPVPVPVAIDTPTTPQTAPALATRIQTDPTIVQRLSIPPQPRSWTIIGDDELLRSLADAGKPAGIIYYDGHATLVPR